jgi:hypothetical protein
LPWTTNSDEGEVIYTVAKKIKTAPKKVAKKTAKRK